MYHIKEAFRQPMARISWLTTLAVSSLLMAAPALAGDESITSSGYRASTGTLNEAAMAIAQPRMPMLTDPSQIPLPEGTTLGIVGPTAFGTDPAAPGPGTGNHPFTTKMASITSANRIPVFLHPLNKTGKLWMRFGASWYVCTASLLKPGVLVTAAHCVHNYGQGAAGLADEVLFDPARHGSGSSSFALPYGTWTVLNFWVPTVYYNGTDTCTVTGVVCENDVAVVALAQNAGQHLGSLVGTYNYYRNSNPYTSFLGMTAAQFTQLGYPVAFESGFKMIRTDSLGYQATPSNVIIGSAQTGGSSGGPWLMNFGANPATTTSTPSFNHPNRVSAVTSWGYVSDVYKVQGASRFSTNTSFTSQSNIDALLDAACTAYPGNC